MTASPRFHPLQESKRLLMQAHLRSEKQGRPDEPRGSVAISSAEFQGMAREGARLHSQGCRSRGRTDIVALARRVHAGGGRANHPASLETVEGFCQFLVQGRRVARRRRHGTS